MSTPACSFCGVEYIEGHEGPCQEFAPNATDAQIQRGKAPMCPGTVSLGLTLERRIAALVNLLSETLNVLEDESVITTNMAAQDIVHRGRTILRG
jgi:hypothetical protein